MAEEIESQEMEASPELEKAINAATSHDELLLIMRAEREKQSGDTSIATPVVEATEDAGDDTEENNADKSYYEDIVIGGQTYKFEGDSPADVIRQIKAATAAHENATKPKQEVKAEAKTGLTPDEKVALDLEYRMGKISTETYLDKTGALDAYLEKKGLKVDDLKEIVQEKISSKVNNQWNSAVEGFLKETDWPGGAQNEKIIKLKLAELKLEEPTVASLTKAYDAMKAEGLVFANSETKQEVRTEPVKKKASGSSLFGIGSSSGKPAVNKKTTAPEITENMSPTEIYRAWKESAIAQGLHPDELLMQSQGR
jgi:hypothetical protein